MALVFAKDHQEGAVKYLAGNECPAGFPHPRKRELVLSGVLKKSSEGGAGGEGGGAPALPTPPFLTVTTVTTDDAGPNEDH